MDQLIINNALEDLKVLRLLIGSNYGRNENDGLFYFLCAGFWITNWLLYSYVNQILLGVFSYKDYWAINTWMPQIQLIWVIVLPFVLGCLIRFNKSRRKHASYRFRLWLKEAFEALFVVVMSLFLYPFFVNPSENKSHGMFIFLFFIGLAFYLTGVGWNFRYRIVGFMYLVSAILVMLFPNHYDMLYVLAIGLALLFAGTAGLWQYKKSMKLATSIAA